VFLKEEKICYRIILHFAFKVGGASEYKFRIE